jgi:DNA-binding NarL/FixJ family response regulator
MQKILIVDDHAIIRCGVKLVLEELLVSFEYYEAENKNDANKLLKEQSNFNLIILDVNMPNYSCERMIENCRISSPKAKIMILTMNAESMMAKKFYQLGVDAFVEKGADLNQLKSAFADLFAGKRYFSMDLLLQLAQNSLSPDENPTNPFDLLSQREFEVLMNLFLGKNLQDVGNTLSLHPSSVSTYKARIFEKMKVNNLIELHEMYKLFNKQ